MGGNLPPWRASSSYQVVGRLGEEGQTVKKGEGSSSMQEGGEGPSTAPTALAWML